jgi:hypothetical protein
VHRRVAIRALPPDVTLIDERDVVKVFSRRGSTPCPTVVEDAVLGATPKYPASGSIAYGLPSPAA